MKPSEKRTCDLYTANVFPPIFDYRLDMRDCPPEAMEKSTHSVGNEHIDLLYAHFPVIPTPSWDETFGGLSCLPRQKDWHIIYIQPLRTNMEGSHISTMPCQMVFSHIFHYFPIFTSGCGSLLLLLTLMIAITIYLVYLNSMTDFLFPTLVFSCAIISWIVPNLHGCLLLRWWRFEQSRTTGAAEKIQPLLSGNNVNESSHLLGAFIRFLAPPCQDPLFSGISIGI